MARPQYLKKGDTVYLLNISRKGSINMPFVKQVFSDWGLQIVIGETITHEGFCQFSQTQEKRLEDLQTALDDEKVRAIFFCRGGYGTVQILDKIDFSKFIENPKWLIGFSDITYLHAHIHNNFNIETIHGAMLFGFHVSDKADLESMRASLFGEMKQLDFENLENHKVASVEGELVGGNLSILHTVIGTPSDLNTDGKILFIEDTYENLMSIERMLHAFKRSGKLEKLKALLIGDFNIPIKDNERSNSMVMDYPTPDEHTVGFALKVVILDLLKDYDFPICFGLPIGHIEGRNIALILGRKVQLDMTSDSLKILYSK